MGRLLLGLWIVTQAGPARAHCFPHPKKEALLITGHRVRLMIDDQVNPGAPSATLRALFDRNGDGRLDPDEQAQLADYLVASARQFLQITVDGAPLPLAETARTTDRLDDPTGSDALLAVTVVLEARLPAGPAARTVTLSDRVADPAMHVPLVVQLGPGLILDRASAGVQTAAGGPLRGINLMPGVPLVLRLHGLPR